MTRPPCGGLFLRPFPLYNHGDMPDDYLETKGELSGDLNPKKPKKKIRWWQIALNTVLIAALVGVVGVSANVVYLSVNYGDAFFVDGASMYPALNKSGLIRNADGSYRAITWKDSVQREGDYVDYGWARMGERGLSDLHRFDIVITYYKNDLLQKSDGTYSRKSNASLKIKRIIGLPGETVQIVPVYDDNGNLATPWGNTIITTKDGEVRTYGSYYKFSDFEDAGGETYRSKVTEANQKVGPVTLKDDEYYVLGDNRAGHYSSDSRASDVGPVPSYCLQGKAYLITGLRRLSQDANGSYSPVFALDKIRPFWAYSHLEISPFENTLISTEKIHA